MPQDNRRLPDGERLDRAERGQRQGGVVGHAVHAVGRQVVLGVGRVTGEEVGDALAPSDGRDVPGEVAGSRDEEDPAVLRDRVGRPERPDRRAVEID